MKKNIIITIMVLTIAATLTACGGGSNHVPDSQQQAEAEVFVIPIGGMIIFPLQDENQDQGPPAEWHNNSENLEVWWEKSFEDPVYPFAGWRIKGVEEGIVEMYDTKGNLLMVIYITNEIDDEYVILADTTD